jgi:tetratricopeptide (TPR) repeat protein
LRFTCQKKSFFEQESLVIKNKCTCAKYIIVFIISNIFLSIYGVDNNQSIIHQFRIVKNLENAGHIKEAKDIIEILYSKYSNNNSIFNHILDFYLRLQEYDRLIEIVEEKIEKYPDDPNLKIKAARIYYRKEQSHKAFEIWQSVLNQYPKESKYYQMIGNIMIQERLIEEAIKIYLQGREKIGKKDIFILNLANLYAVSMEYDKAADELLSYLRKYPKQRTYVEGQLLRYLNKNSNIEKIISELEKNIDSDPKNISFKQVLSRIYFKTERYEETIEIIKEIERLSKKEKQGESLFNFANEAFRSGLPEIAEKAYNSILELYPHFKKKDRVIFGLAESQEAQQMFEAAINTYQMLIDEFKRSALSRRALFRKGVIQRIKLFDPSGAEVTFQFLLKKYAHTAVGRNGHLELGRCYIDMGNLDRAEEVFRKIIDMKDRKEWEYRVKALTYLAETLYLKQSFEEALSILDSLSDVNSDQKAIQDPVLNDGLKLLTFLKEHVKSSPQQLQILARSEFWERQKQYNKAIITLDTLINKWKDHSLTADALYKKGLMKIYLGQLKQGVADFDSLVSRFPKSLLADKALERIGWIYEKMGKEKYAMKKYEELLIVYPQSFLYDDIRRRIRRIEKDIY